ncbi:hypothetical protein OY671_008549, partial [Metschnikowia pulcherrima]
GRMENIGRRRHGVGRDRLRQGSRPDLPGRGQRQPVEPRAALERRRGQSVPLLGRGAGCHHRPLQVALSGNPGGKSGLHRHPADHSGRTGGEREDDQGAVPRAEERLLLCDRPRDGPVHLGQQLCPGESGDRAGPGDGPADREPGFALRQDGQALHQHAGRGGRAFVAPDGLRSRAEAGVHPRAVCRVPLFSGQESEAFARRLQRGHRSGGERDAGRRQGPRRGARRHHRGDHRSGPGGAEGTSARQLPRPVERRPAGHRRRPAVPGQR